mmetsp:Transcript_21772/g.60826  ORF Transcript_21772/g.60826 Transcript_21772/m.60826 type:complete len:251 (-) Transcript_21772:1364-2116(-)
MACVTFMTPSFVDVAATAGIPCQTGSFSDVRATKSALAMTPSNGDAPATSNTCGAADVSGANELQTCAPFVPLSFVDVTTMASISCGADFLSAASAVESFAAFAMTPSGCVTAPVASNIGVAVNASDDCKIGSFAAFATSTSDTIALMASNFCGANDAFAEPSDVTTSATSEAPLTDTAASASSGSTLSRKVPAACPARLAPGASGSSPSKPCGRQKDALGSSTLPTRRSSMSGCCSRFITTKCKGASMT